MNKNVNKYRVRIEGVIKYPKMVETENIDGETTLVNDTAGIEVEKTFTAETHSEAKQLVKQWVSEHVANREAVGFEGTVSAWVITEKQLLDKAPFNVEVTRLENIIVDI